MTYTFDQLKADVKKEAEALRVHATQEELGRLDIDGLKPAKMESCIYGQMTGNCFSKRAASLINRCCIRFFKHEVMPGFINSVASMGRIRENVNGIKVKGYVKERTTGNSPHFSAIEAYILLPEARNANLIAYLRGETETLDL